MSEIIKADIPVDIITITQLHKLATTEHANLAGQSIDNDNEAAEANEYLRDWLSKLDGVSAKKKETLAPLKEAEKRINDLFKPLLDKGAALTSAIRKMLTDYELAKRDAQRKALEEAAQAASSPEPKALLEALEKVEEAAPTQLDGTSFTRKWVVKRIAEDLLPDEYWTPDVKKIEAIGKAHKGDTPPVVPGVIWAEELSSRVRR